MFLRWSENNANRGTVYPCFRHNSNNINDMKLYPEGSGGYG